MNSLVSKFYRAIVPYTRRGRAITKLDTALNDTETFQTLLNEKKLALVAMISSISGVPEHGFEAAKREMQRFIHSSYQSIPTPDQYAALQACTEVIAYLNASLAIELNQTPEETWQRVAMYVNRSISEGGDDR